MKHYTSWFKTSLKSSLTKNIKACEGKFDEECFDGIFESISVSGVRFILNLEKRAFL